MARSDQIARPAGPARRRRRAALLLLAAGLAGLAGCTGGPSATPSPSPTPSLSPTSSPTAPPEPETVIGVLGDFGVDAAPVRQVVGLLRGFGPLDALVTTGDNAYQRGTPSQAAFARRVLGPALGPRTRLVASLGNHDVASDSTGGPVRRAFGMPGRWYAATVGPVELVVLDSNRTTDPAQLGFLDRTLATRRTPFRIAVFHHPAASCSAHRPDPYVVRHFVPRLRGRVDLILTGHNHTYERFATEPPYVTTGGGGATLYASSQVACTGRAVRLRTVHHALRLVATRTQLTVEAVAVSGEVFDRFAISP